MKYYIEIEDLEAPYECIMQSKFFDTEEQAVEWSEAITWLDEDLSISLMEADWDDKNEWYNDIGFVRYLR